MIPVVRKVRSLLDKKNKLNTIIDNIEKFKMISKDPEHFLINGYYKTEVPKGFRIELFIARKYNLICDMLKQSNLTPLEIIDSWLEKGKLTSMVPVKKIREAVSAHWQVKHPKKTFCPYCEKPVIPKRLHKLDLGDIALFLMTGGIWAILLFAVYLFTRRCPICNYDLRGFKPISETN